MNWSVFSVILLTTCFLLSEAGLFNGDKPDPVKLLSDKLAKLTDNQDLTENVKVAREHDWQKEPEYGQNSFREALGAFKRFEPQDTCRPENVEGALKLRKLSGQKKFGSRLTHIVDSIAKSIASECFDRAEDMWRGDPKRISQISRDVYELSEIDGLLKKYAHSIKSPSTYDVQALSGAIELMKGRQMDGPSVRKALSEIHFHKKAKKKVKNWDLPKNISKHQAAELIVNYLVEPCKKLTAQPEAKTFFKPITDWARLVLENFDSTRKSRSTYMSFLWSARWTFCGALLDKLTDGIVRDLAEKVAKSDH